MIHPNPQVSTVSIVLIKYVIFMYTFIIHIYIYLYIRLRSFFHTTLRLHPDVLLSIGLYRSKKRHDWGKYSECLFSPREESALTTLFFFSKLFCSFLWPLSFFFTFDFPRIQCAKQCNPATCNPRSPAPKQYSNSLSNANPRSTDGTCSTK